MKGENMRDIRFRAWDKKEKTMNYSAEGRIVDGRLIAFDLMIEWRRNIYSSEWELMQFTGLHDKNGKEIYENDLIKVNINVCVSGHAYTGDDEWIDVDYYAVVKFMPSKGFYGKVLRATNNIDDTEPRATKMVTIASYRTEVIGNIYSNPELAGRTE